MNIFIGHWHLWIRVCFHYNGILALRFCAIHEAPNWVRKFNNPFRTNSTNEAVNLHYAPTSITTPAGSVFITMRYVIYAPRWHFQSSCIVRFNIRIHRDAQMHRTQIRFVIKTIQFITIQQWVDWIVSFYRRTRTIVGQPQQSPGRWYEHLFDAFATVYCRSLKIRTANWWRVEKCLFARHSPLSFQIVFVPNHRQNHWLHNVSGITNWKDSISDANTNFPIRFPFTDAAPVPSLSFLQMYCSCLCRIRAERHLHFDSTSVSLREISPGQPYPIFAF